MYLDPFVQASSLPVNSHSELVVQMLFFRGFKQAIWCLKLAILGGLSSQKLLSKRLKGREQICKDSMISECIHWTTPSLDVPKEVPQYAVTICLSWVSASEYPCRIWRVWTPSPETKRPPTLLQLRIHRIPTAPPATPSSGERRSPRLCLVSKL